MICKYILDYVRPCCHTPILEKRLRYLYLNLPVNTYLYISQTTYVRTHLLANKLTTYLAFIAQSATLTQMTQGQHKSHTDPADHTHIAGQALRNTALTQASAQSGTRTHILHRGHTSGHRSSHTHPWYCITQHVTLHSHRILHRPLHLRYVHSQGQHKCHTDPADHTHIRSRSRTTEHCTYAGNCTERYNHIYIAQGSHKWTQIMTHITCTALRSTQHCTHTGNYTDRYTHTCRCQMGHTCKWT